MARVFSLFMNNGNKDKNDAIHNRTVHQLLNSDPPLNTKINKTHARPSSANQNVVQSKLSAKNKGNKNNSTQPATDSNSNSTITR